MSSAINPNSIKVENIDSSVTIKDLSSLFEELGGVKCVLFDKNVAEAEVRFETKQTAQRAFKVLNGLEFRGKCLLVTKLQAEKEDKDENETKIDRLRNEVDQLNLLHKYKFITHQQELLQIRELREKLDSLRQAVKEINKKKYVTKDNLEARLADIKEISRQMINYIKLHFF